MPNYETFRKMYRHNSPVMPYPIRTHPYGAAARPPLMSVPGRLGAALLRWSQRRRSRGALAQLDDRLLGDVGLTRAERDREAAKRFWIP